MTVVLGLDAAWTPAGESGVGLVADRDSGWRVRGVAPSYACFRDLAEGRPVDWSQRKVRGGVPSAAELLGAAEKLAGSPVDIVAIDMPISRGTIRGRRAADDAISKAFGARGCSTHSPTSERPGALGAALTREFALAGYSVETCADPPTRRCLIEVYPHPALLELLQRPRRVPYKVQKSAKYWPRTGVRQRIESLLAEFRAIRAGLGRELGATRIDLPKPDRVPSLAWLRRLENSLDALVCAWVGVRFAAGEARAYGDSDAAIFCPVTR